MRDAGAVVLKIGTRPMFCTDSIVDGLVQTEVRQEWRDVVYTLTPAGRRALEVFDGMELQVYQRFHPRYAAAHPDAEEKSFGGTLAGWDAETVRVWSAGRVWVFRWDGTEVTDGAPIFRASSL